MAILRRDILPIGQVLTNSGQVDGAVLWPLMRRFDPTEANRLRMAVYEASQAIEALARCRPDKALIDKQTDWWSETWIALAASSVPTIQSRRHFFPAR